MRTLLNHIALDGIQASIETNRNRAADLMRSTDPDAGEMISRLNGIWFDLEEARADLEGVKLAPYRMR